jgi:sulfite reductase beta subunit-like hemoprotein
MNENERIKQEKPPLEVLPNFEKYAREGFESIDPDDFLRFRWYGLYQQKPNVGHFMLRIKVPNGILTAAQVRTVADVAKLYGRGITDITTRQNFQFHWLTVQDIPDILKRFMDVGIVTEGACGDIPRNVTGCPVAGIEPDEIFDASPFAESIHKLWLESSEYADLPRKFKTAVSGCCQNCSQPEINDIGATGVRRTLPDGTVEEGFHIRVGGGLSARPFIAKPLNMFVPKDEAKLRSVFHAIVTIFRDHGNRENRKAARLKFLVDQWGIEKFEAEVRARLDWTPDPATEWPEPRKAFRDHMGIHKQKQDGLFWIGAVVLGGRLTADQVYEAARIAEEYGDGVVRTTNQQNFLFSGIPEAKVEEAARLLEGQGYQVRGLSPLRRAAVSCTGNEFCNLALTETKQLIVEIVEHLEKTVALDELIRINLNGCPNSCGQHHIGDIGLQGCLVKQGPGQTVEGYDISLGGRLGEGAKFVRPIWRKVPATNVAKAIEHLLNNYAEQKDPDEFFGDFVDRHNNEELAALMQTKFAEGVPEPVGAASA